MNYEMIELLTHLQRTEANLFNVSLFHSLFSNRLKEIKISKANYALALRGLRGATNSNFHQFLVLFIFSLFTIP